MAEAPITKGRLTRENRSNLPLVQVLWDIGAFGVEKPKKVERAGNVAQWRNICLVCARPWAPSIALQKKKKKYKQVNLCTALHTQV